MSPLLSHRRRVLPDYVILGAQKSGTTSLHAYLGQHPQIRSPKKKEIHYFDTYFGKGPAWYRGHFPRRRTMGRDQISGEASPAYLSHPRCARRIARALPGVKLIALLRDPAQRAVSSYLHQVRRGREKLPFAEALAAEPQRTAAARRILESRDRYPARISLQYRRYSYRARGLYAHWLARYLEHFDRTQVFIRSAEEFFADPAAVLRDLFAFLDIDPDFTPTDLRPRNTTDYSRYPEIDDAMVERLRAEYAPHNRELYALVGRDFGW